VTDVRVPNEPEGEAASAFGELLRIQGEFQTRLAEEALKYLHRLQGTAMPAAPGTVMVPGASAGLRAAGRPGESVELRLEVENRQRVHCSLAPTLTPLVSASGTTWFPAAEPSPVITLVAPGEVAPVLIRLPLPSNLPAGTYNGALVLQGFREGAVAVTVVVGDEADGGGGAKSTPKSTDDAEVSAPRKRSAAKAKKGRRTASKRA
jgi:hypothetical protein